MASYSSIETSGYNSSPPSDDGAQTEANRITWSGIKTKLTDPIRAALQAIDASLVTMLGADGTLTVTHLITDDDVTINGDLDVDDIACGDLTATGPVTFHDDLDIDGNLTVDNDINCSGEMECVDLDVFKGEDGAAVSATAGHTSYASPVYLANVNRTSNSAYDFFRGISDADGVPDTEVRLKGDGNCSCDGSFTGSGADYAEMFEWLDGAPGEDMVGHTVVLVGDKIRPAAEGEDPIGVISARPSILGNNPLNWPGKDERDAFGRRLLDGEGKRMRSKKYDPSKPYVQRSERPEWAPVGLVGRLRVWKGAPVSSRWIKLRESDAVAEYLVR